MLTPRQSIDNEFWVLRSLLHDRGVLDIELDKHLERTQILMRTLAKGATQHD